MDFDFSAYKPDRRTSWFDLPIEGKDGRPSRLRLKHAGMQNRGYFAAVTKRSAARASRNSGKVSAQRIMENMQQGVSDIRALYPEHVVDGWENVVDKSGEIVSFSTDACSRFFEALPDWILQRIGGFAENAVNFIADDEPSEAEVEERAGN